MSVAGDASEPRGKDRKSKAKDDAPAKRAEPAKADKPRRRNPFKAGSLRPGTSNGAPKQHKTAPPQPRDATTLRLPPGRIAESYRTLRTNIVLAANHTPTTVLVTSAVAGEGKTTTSLGLAMASVGASQRTVLVEADFFAPRLCNYLGLDAGEHDVLDALRNGGIAQPMVLGGLHVLPAPRHVPEPAQYLRPEVFEPLLAWLRARYDFIVIDTAPALHVSESLLLGKIADGVITVVNAQQVDRNSQKRLRRMLQDNGVNVFGTVLDRADAVGGAEHEYGEYGEYGGYGSRSGYGG